MANPFFDPVESLKGVGPKTATSLAKAGLKTVKDFFYNLPRTYENYAAPTKISAIEPGKITIKAELESIKTRRTSRRNLTITEAVLKDETGMLLAVWFNQSYREKQLKPGETYFFQGLYELKNRRYQLTSPTIATPADLDKKATFRPVYSAHGSLKTADFERLISVARDRFAFIPDLLPLPSAEIKAPKIVAPNARADALFDAHFPKSQLDVDRARAYLGYEEIFELILASTLNKKANQKLQAPAIPFDAAKIKAFLATLPFELTHAQKRSAWEIFQDLEKTTPMNRLLQGDVGSGKTMVAALAAFEAIQGNGQVALLAPTAILATQHYENLKSKLEPFHITVALLTGSTKKKSDLKANIKSGQIQLVIGTHALLTDDTEFKNLSLVIIDEQHRFGVEQRQKLMLKSPAGLAPHLLAMTATPIPRSLQLTIFGDLDVSILNEMPKGRQPIATKILPEVLQRTDLYPAMLDTIKNHHQIYWICKAIEDSPTSEATSVRTRTEKLQSTFPRAKIAYLHGRMKPAEKDEIMATFAAGAIDILVSTTVVEVGVDVPNATDIIIENAEQYGLAQLHQLRGRVGRGQIASRCYLLTESDHAPSRRLRELEKSTDGFHLAEVDLSLRGPGEIYGSLQHGALNLKIASLGDTQTIHLARTHALSFAAHPELFDAYPELMSEIKKYQQLTTLN